MSYYHLRIVYKLPEHAFPTTDYELDLSEAEASQFGEQYERGKVFFKGKWINSLNIEEIQIRETSHQSTTYFRETVDSASIFYGTKVPTTNVTRRFIRSQPKEEEIFEKKEKAKQPLSKNIFIVHGRDHEPMKELKAMLYEFGLNPIVLHEQPSGSRTIVEKLERYSDVGYAFVILTPDDAGALGRSFARLLNALRRDFFRYMDIDANARAERNLRKMHSLLKRRARQNVVLEFGYFIGLLNRDRVCCLLKGNVERPSDMEGIVYVAFKRSVNEVRNMIIKELEEAGYEIRL